MNEESTPQDPQAIAEEKAAAPAGPAPESRRGKIIFGVGMAILALGAILLAVAAFLFYRDVRYRLVIAQNAGVQALLGWHSGGQDNSIPASAQLSLNEALRLAKETMNVSIKDCFVDPVLLKVYNYKDITFWNDGERPISLIFPTGHRAPISPRSSLTINIKDIMSAAGLEAGKIMNYDCQVLGRGIIFAPGGTTIP